MYLDENYYSFLIVDFVHFYFFDFHFLHKSNDKMMDAYSVWISKVHHDGLNLRMNFPSKTVLISLPFFILWLLFAFRCVVSAWISLYKLCSQLSYSLAFAWHSTVYWTMQSCCWNGMYNIHSLVLVIIMCFYAWHYTYSDRLTFVVTLKTVARNSSIQKNLRMNECDDLRYYQCVFCRFTNSHWIITFCIFACLYPSSFFLSVHSFLK